MSTETREPVLDPAIPEAQDPVAEAGCASFESTLALMDGTLAGDALATARTHVAACTTCGPLVAGWSLTSSQLTDAFEETAEAAKPEFAAMTERIMERLGPAPTARPAVVEAPSFASRLFGSLQGWLALGAATAALALVLYPMLASGPSSGNGTPVATNDPSTHVTPPVPVPVPAPVPEPRPVLAVEEEPEDLEDPGSPDELASENVGVVVRRVAFEGADGMVFCAPESDLTVIWVNEYDGT